MLRIAKLTDYAIVLLAHLTRQGHVCRHSANDLSEATQVPLPTVQKVLKQLSREGLLVSVRGAHGGYSLARDPARISVAEVVAVMEGPLALTACSVPGLDLCGEQHHCQVSGHWPVINRAVRSALDSVSILDISRPPASRNGVSVPPMPTNASTAGPAPVDHDAPAPAAAAGE